MIERGVGGRCKKKNNKSTLQTPSVVVRRPVGKEEMFGKFKFTLQKKSFEWTLYLEDNGSIDLPTSRPIYQAIDVPLTCFKIREYLTVAHQVDCGIKCVKGATALIFRFVSKETGRAKRPQKSEERYTTNFFISLFFEIQRGLCGCPFSFYSTDTRGKKRPREKGREREREKKSGARERDFLVCLAREMSQNGPLLLLCIRVYVCAMSALTRSQQHTHKGDGAIRPLFFLASLLPSSSSASSSRR